LETEPKSFTNTETNCSAKSSLKLQCVNRGGIGRFKV
jgi:hypothetical protein